ncbi:DNA-directed RNA polymerase subunit beta [Alkalihalobacillus sp. BA299]|uniref:DNA-directed RNA polymerase subunit beta n=1 Tax=Alkalihalobacillus sp. BA299 TaxID=2815938 RepID=UPI001FFE1E36|nr:DNA-directed RNA polymerase subunit beta [Alkalihalobacillus sp. BA299]
MENRDLEKDKLNIEQQPKEPAPEANRNHDEGAGEAARPISTDAVGKEDREDQDGHDREDGEAERYAALESTTSESGRDEDEQRVDNKENDPTKIFSSTDRTSFDTSNGEGEKGVDMSKDTIIHQASTVHADRPSRSSNKATLTTDEKETLASLGEPKDTREERTKRKKRRKERVRLVPVWLRLFIVILLCGLSLVGGLMFGYGVVGEGIPTDVLKRETWEHIVKIISGAE